MSARASFEQPDEDRASSDPYETLVLPLLSGWRWLVAGMLFGGLVALVWGVNRPNTFESTAKLLVRTGAREQSTPETRLALTDREEPMAAREAVQNEVHLLGDPAVIEAVARKVTPERLLAAYDPGVNDDHDTPVYVRSMHKMQSWWFGKSSFNPDHPIDACDQCVRQANQTLLDNLVIRPEAGSSVLTLAYTAHSAELAREVVRAFVDVAIEHHQHVFATDSSLELLQRQVAEAQAGLSRAENALAQNRIQCNIFDVESRRRLLLEELGKLESKLQDDGVRLDELRSLAQLLGAALEKEPATTEQIVDRAPVDNPAYTTILNRIHEQQSAVEDLDTRDDLTRSEIESKRATIEKQIADLRAELQKQPVLLETGTGTTSVTNPRYERLVEREDEVTEELTALESGLQKRVARKAELNAELQRLEECEPNMRLLQADVDIARARSAQLTTARDKLEVMNMLDRVNMSNMRLIQEASLPMTKVGPKRGRMAAIGTLLGCGAGILLLFLFRTFDRRVQSPRDVFAMNGRGVVCVVPKAGRIAVPPTKPWRRAAL